MKPFLVCLLVLACGLCALGQDSLNVRRVGSLDYWDSAVKLEVVGNYAFIACHYGGLRIVDVTNPSEPVEVGSYAPGIRIDCLASSGDYVYLGTIYDIRIINIENPSNPIQLSLLPMDPVQDIAVSGSYLYAMTFSSELHVIDASNPLLPVEVASLGSTGSFVAIQESYAYVTAGWYGLRVVDISDPLTPHEVGSVDPLAFCGDLVVSSTGAYVAGGTDGLLLISVSDPTAPDLVSGLITEGPAMGTAVTEDFEYVFVAAGNAGIRAIDVVPAYGCHEVGSYDTPGTSYAVVLSGNYAYVADGLGGLLILDVSNSSFPTAVGSLSHPGRVGDVSLAGNYAYVAAGMGGLQVIDFSSPQIPTVVGSCLVGGSKVTVQGAHAYTAAGNYIYIVDISNPSTPTEVISAPLYNWILTDIAVAGPYAYIACWQEASLPHQPYPYCKLAIVDISNSSAPVLTGYCTGGIGSTGSVAVDGNYAYMTALINGSSNLWTINVSNPSAPVSADVFALSGASGIAIADNRAYIACGESGLAIVNVSNPSSPSLISTFDTPGEARDVALFSNYAFDYAFVADGSGGLRILDVTDPSDPFETGYYDAARNATAVAVSEDLAFVTELAYLGIYDCSAALSAHPQPKIIPNQFALHPAYPNPFNSTTTLRLELPTDIKARLVVYDVLGRNVATLADGMMRAGSHNVQFDGQDLASGTYLIHLDTPEFSRTQKVMLLK